MRNPPLEQYEAAFVEHAKAWADDTGVTAAAFTAEGVPAAMLRRAGFRRITNGARRTRRAAERPSRTRRRVISEEVDAGNLTDQGPDPDHTGPRPRLHRLRTFMGRSTTAGCDARRAT